jgi:hypothetical protein
MNESRVLRPEFRSNISTVRQARFSSDSAMVDAAGTPRLGGVNPSSLLRASRVRPQREVITVVILVT